MNKIQYSNSIGVKREYSVILVDQITFKIDEFQWHERIKMDDSLIL